MTYDNSSEAATREYLAGALRALDRGDAPSAVAEIVQALHYGFSVVRERSDADPLRYRSAWERVAQELSRLPPSLLRHAVHILDDRSDR